MNDQELIVYQTKKIIELESSLEASKKNATLFYNEWQELQKKLMPAQSLSAEETVHALANAKFGGMKQ